MRDCAQGFSIRMRMSRNPAISRIPAETGHAGRGFPRRITERCRDSQKTSRSLSRVWRAAHNRRPSSEKGHGLDETLMPDRLQHVPPLRRAVPHVLQQHDAFPARVRGGRDLRPGTPRPRCAMPRVDARAAAKDVVRSLHSLTRPPLPSKYETHCGDPASTATPTTFPLTSSRNREIQ